MVKKSDTAMPIRLTAKDEADFQRFGCTLDSKTGSMCVDWRGRELASVLAAEIVARLGRLDDDSIVFLAFEVAAIRPIPNYCYFPFDLSNQKHREYLDHVTDTGEIKLSFTSGKQSIHRIHKLSPYFLCRSTDAYERVLRASQDRSANEDVHVKALESLERWVKIPQFLEHSLSDTDVREIVSRVKEQARGVDQEDKDLAHRIVMEGKDTLRQYSDSVGGYGALFKRIHRSGMVLGDFSRTFHDDEAGLIEFCSDLLSSSSSHADLENLRKIVRVMTPLTRFLPKEKSVTSLAPKIPFPEVPPKLPGLIEQVRSGVSWHWIKRLLNALNIPVISPPGRPPEDYSREYENRVLGKKSWSEVTRQALEDRPELRDEFGGRRWDALDALERDKVRNRVRQGVTTYAKRMGKLLPTAQEESDRSSDGGEENPPVSLQVK